MVIRNSTFKYKCKVCKQAKESRAYNTKVCPGRCRELWEQRLRQRKDVFSRLLVRLEYHDGLEQFGFIDNDLLCLDRKSVV